MLGFMAWHVEHGLGSSSCNSFAVELCLDQVIAKLFEGVNALSSGQLGNPAGIKQTKWMVRLAFLDNLCG